MLILSMEMFAGLPSDKINTRLASPHCFKHGTIIQTRTTCKKICLQHLSHSVHLEACKKYIYLIGW